MVEQRGSEFGLGTPAAVSDITAGHRLMAAMTPLHQETAAGE